MTEYTDAEKRAMGERVATEVMGLIYHPEVPDEYGCNEWWESSDGKTTFYVLAFHDSHDQINAAIAEWCGEDRKHKILWVQEMCKVIPEVDTDLTDSHYEFGIATPLQKTLALLNAFDALNGAMSEQEIQLAVDQTITQIEARDE